MVLKRAYSLLRVKSANAEQRTITGTASTPEPDRMGDIVEPLGISYTNPVPLLLYHNTTKPVGQVRFFPPTKDGLAFEATLPTIDEAGTLRDRVEEAWQSIVNGLLAGVSIGFRAIEEAWITETQSFRFIKSEVLELSLVSIPANASATIDTIKSLDLERVVLHTSTPPLTAGHFPVVRAMRGASIMQQTKTIPEQIAAFEATRASKSARQTEIMNAAAEGGTTLDGPQAEEYDNVAADVRSIDAHLVRLRALESSNLARATAVTGTADRAIAERGASPIVTVTRQLKPATAFIRYCQALAACQGNKMQAVEWSKQWRDSTPEVELALKAAVAPGTTTDATWAGPLAPLKPLVDEFLPLLRAATILDRVPGMRPVPFNISVPAQTGGGTYGWVGQGAPKPVGKLTFGTLTLAIAKCSGIIVITEELARISTPSAEEIIRQDMIRGIATFLDIQFTDPTVAAVANVSPGSVTNTVAKIPSVGPTPANARTDIQALAAAMTALNISTGGAVLLMSETNALALASALNPLGQQLFPGLGASGGRAMGYDVLTSQSLGQNVVLVKGDGILMADEGGVEIDVSREASVQMDNAPMNPADATVVMTSLWQNNLVGLRADRIITWKVARQGTVQYTQQTYVAA
jgi:HK97 family phage major capsid protein/HK97 family phage prohead protease